MSQLARSPLALVAALALLAGGAHADTPVKAGDTVSVRGTLTAELSLADDARRGAVKLSNTKDGEIGQALQFLAGEQVVLEGEYKGTQALADAGGALTEVQTRVRVTKILSPAFDGSAEGVVLFRAGTGKLYLYEGDALQAEGYTIKNLPAQVLLNLRNVRLKFATFRFDASRELKLVSVRCRVRLPGFLSDEALAKAGANAGLKPGDELSLKVPSLKVWTRGKPELEPFVDPAHPETFRAVDRQHGEFLFGEVKTKDGRRGFVPLWKLWLGRASGHGPAGPGVTGALGDATGGQKPADVEDRILAYLQAVHDEHVNSAYAWAYEDAKDDADKLKELRASHKEDLQAFEYNANGDGDLDPFDGWLLDDEWKDHYDVEAKDVVVYSLNWYTAPEGIGLSQYFAFNKKTGELVTESDVWD
ncbi:MAG: hypothetical protein KDD82_24130 [Planctomycetes bacterium]|nr:hypothetical protein [Planctomycetota bacterium]